VVGTPNWEIFKRQGRIDSTFQLENLHGYSTHYSHPHFEKGETLEIAKNFQRRIYREKGPSILKAIEVELNGYEYCLNHSDPVLRRDKVAYLAHSIRNQAPILAVVRERAETEAIQAHASRVIDRYLGYFGAVDSHFEKKAERLVRRYDREAEKRATSLDPLPPYFSLDTIETHYAGVGSLETLEVEPICA
jgi:hypothetical protein